MRVRLAVLVLLVCGIGVAWASGVLAHLHPESIRAFLTGWGALGPVIFVGLYALGEGEADFDNIAIVYYPGVEYFAELLQSEFFTGIVGGKQLGDTLSSPTVPLLPHL